MRLMTLVAIVSVSTFAHAGSINPDSPASRWRGETSSSRLAYATQVAVVCQSSNCGSLQIKACMDEVTRPPAPDAVAVMTVGELAVGCIKMLKVQQ